MRRVVVTGIGLVTPLACGVKYSWQRLINAESGIGKITRFDASDMACQIAAEVPWAENDDDTTEWKFNPNRSIPSKEQRKMDYFIQYGMVASDEAVADSGWEPKTEDEQKRTGVLIGSGIGGLPEIERTSVLLHEKGPKRVSPFFIPSTLINLTAGFVSMKYSFRGPNHSVVTACSTGAHAIGDAARLIALDDADVMVAGSTEGAICPLGIAGFSSARALSSKYNDTPEKASRPWDEGRDGFVMGEGAGIVVLEELEHAKKRGAKIYGEVIGYGLSGDAHHITAPHEEGRGAYDAMKSALKRANINTDQVDYVNAHGTSTPLGDEVEYKAVERLFGNHAKHLSMSSTKSSIAHLLGGAGSVEAIFCLLAMKDSVIPPTLNLDNPSEACRGIDLVPNQAKEKNIDIAVTNSFGFGGTNVSVVLKKYKG